MTELKVCGVYRARNGEKVEIVSYDNDTTYPFSCNRGLSYTPQGTEYKHSKSCWDLIEEWHDEPKVGKWIGWNGGECPVHPDTVVEVVGGFDNPWTSKAHHKFVEWSNVTSYRVVKPHVEPREFWVKGDIAYNHSALGGVHVREVMTDE